MGIQTPTIGLMTEAMGVFSTPHMVSNYKTHLLVSVLVHIISCCFRFVYWIYEICGSGIK